MPFPRAPTGLQDSCVTPASVTPAKAGVQKLLDSFLLARKDVGKRCFLRASAFSSGESADLRQIENSGSSGELTVSIWFLVRLPEAPVKAGKE